MKNVAGRKKDMGVIPWRQEEQIQNEITYKWYNVKSPESFAHLTTSDMILDVKRKLDLLTSDVVHLPAFSEKFSSNHTNVHNGNCTAKSFTLLISRKKDPLLFYWHIVRDSKLYPQIKALV